MLNTVNIVTVHLITLLYFPCFSVVQVCIALEAHTVRNTGHGEEEGSKQIYWK